MIKKEGTTSNKRKLDTNDSDTDVKKVRKTADSDIVEQNNCILDETETSDSHHLRSREIKSYESSSRSNSPQSSEASSICGDPKKSSSPYSTDHIDSQETEKSSASKLPLDAAVKSSTEITTRIKENVPRGEMM